MLGLSHYLAGRIAESIPFLEQTRGWRCRTAPSSPTSWAWPTSRRASPPRRASSWARAFGVAPDSAAAHLADRADDGPRGARGDGGGGAEAGAGEGPAPAARPLPPRARRRSSAAASTRRVALLQRELELNPGDAMAFYRLGDAYSAPAQVGRGDRRAAESIWLNPYFSGPYILLGKAYMQKGAAAPRPRACCAGPSSTTPTTRPRTTCSASSSSRPAAPRRRGGSWRSRSSLQGAGER